MINREFDSLSEKFNQGKCSEEELKLLRKLANDNLNFQNTHLKLKKEVYQEKILPVSEKLNKIHNTIFIPVSLGIKKF